MTDELVKVSIFEVIDKGQEELEEIVRGFSQNAGYSNGRDVARFPEVPGKYELITHNGEEDIDRGSVRVVGSEIWVGSYADLIRGRLESLGLGYKMWSAEVNSYRLNEFNGRKFNLFFNPTLTYNPNQTPIKVV